MNTTALREYGKLKLELLETERAMELKAAIMHDEVTGLARRKDVYDEIEKKVVNCAASDGKLTDLWWAMLAGKNRLESHRAGLIYQMKRVEPKVMEDRVFLIILAVANGYGIDVGELISSGRKTPLGEARAICWALLINHTTISQGDIAQIFGCKRAGISLQYRTAIDWLKVNHSGVLNHYRSVLVQLNALVPDIDTEKPLEVDPNRGNKIRQAS